jgi:nicotinate-nucleotide adenylyltransferase
MNVALFGGTFDPVHLGHLAVARAARERYSLRRIYFIPADAPPHKSSTTLTGFEHRYAMLALATSGEKGFIPSLLEAPGAARGPNYSIDTVRRLKSTLKKGDRLFFLIGIDAFLEIAAWHKAEELLRQCEFIVASRPGFSLAEVANALPQPLRPRRQATQPFRKQPAVGDVVLSGITIHLLPEVHQRISATAIRAAARGTRPLTRLVPPAVAEYIRKLHLYQPHTISREAGPEPLEPMQVAESTAHGRHQSGPHWARGNSEAR